MAKVTMYRGIDFDGVDSWIAVCNGLCARVDADDDMWGQSSTFGNFEDWMSTPMDDEDRDVISQCIVVWESDL